MAKIWAKPTLLNFGSSLYKDNMAEKCENLFFSEYFHSIFNQNPQYIQLVTNYKLITGKLVALNIFV
jgi:hypothetical protein